MGDQNTADLGAVIYMQCWNSEWHKLDGPIFKGDSTAEVYVHDRLNKQQDTLDSFGNDSLLHFFLLVKVLSLLRTIS